MWVYMYREYAQSVLVQWKWRAFSFSLSISLVCAFKQTEAFCFSLTFLVRFMHVEWLLLLPRCQASLYVGYASCINQDLCRFAYFISLLRIPSPRRRLPLPFVFFFFFFSLSLSLALRLLIFFFICFSLFILGLCCLHFLLLKICTNLVVKKIMHKMKRKSTTIKSNTQMRPQNHLLRLNTQHSVSSVPRILYVHKDTYIHVNYWGLNWSKRF